MKHHRHKPNFGFVHAPVEFDKYTEKNLLQYCLGGTLYMPATRRVVDKLLNQDLNDLTSMVMCFEDAITEENLPEAEENVLRHLRALAGAIQAGEIGQADIPLIFLRVRNAKQFINFTDRLGPEEADVLTGFVFPKFSSENSLFFLNHLAKLNHRLGVKLYGMPILEGSAIGFHETRIIELRLLKNTLEPFRDLILNIRVGATDFSSLFGVRRGMNSSIYDILVVRDCLSDILNSFNRAIDGYVISAPVWEYFLASSGDNIDDIIEQNIHHSLVNRQPIVNDAIDGLLREVILDKSNGFVGKTIIHPSHLKYVNAMQAVTLEEYEDALQILDTNGGVIKSKKSNKMNEINPHRNWAHKVVQCAKAFGVIEEESCYLKLFKN